MDITTERQLNYRNWGDQPNSEIEMELNPRPLSSEDYLQGHTQYYTHSGYPTRNVAPQNIMGANQELPHKCWPCPKSCGKILYIGLGFLLLIYIIVMTAYMLYFGINYNYCQDWFSIWLIIGGVLCCINLLLLGIRSVLKKRFDTDWFTRELTDEPRPRIITSSTGVLLVFLFLTFVWWIVGFMRIATVANYSELAKTDSTCAVPIRMFPFWMLVSSSILFWPGLYVCIYYAVQINPF